MNRKHSIFKKFNKFQQLLLSFIAVMLVLCISPITAFAETFSIGVITKVNGGGSAGKSYNSGDDSWAEMTKDSSGHSQTDFKFMGYRVYVVDAAGTLQSKVIDLTYSNPDTVSNEKRSDTLICGKPESTEIKTIHYTSDSTSVINPTGTPYVYAAGFYDGTHVYGNNFASWMLLKNSNGITNATMLMGHAFGTTQADGYLSHADWKLIVEPLMYTDIWTQREWINVEKTYIMEEFREHYIYWSGDKAYDICCSKSKEVRVFQIQPTPEQLKIAV